MLNQKNSG